MKKVLNALLLVSLSLNIIYVTSFTINILIDVCSVMNNLRLSVRPSFSF